MGGNPFLGAFGEERRWGEGGGGVGWEAYVVDILNYLLSEKQL